MVNSALARIFGSDSDAIWLAPIGTALPTTLTEAPGAAFEDIGWLNTDTGVTETLRGSVSDIRGHQGAGVVRTRIETPGTQFQFVALESKEQTNELRYDIKSSTTTGGVRTSVRGSGQRVKPRAAVIDLYDIDDETVQVRLCIPRLEIVPNGDRTFINSDIAGYPMLGTVIGDITVIETDLENPGA
ncbi:phage tail tube protein [Microbacterium sp. KNMS]